MINFKKYLHQDIGNRVKNFRNKNNYTHQQFVEKFNEKMVYKLEEANDPNYRLPLNPQSLSNIENANVEKKRNPNLLSKKQLDLLPKFMDISKRELIFGNDKDREDTVKLIILSIILNGATTRSEENDKEEFINPLIDLRITPKDHEVLYNDLKRNNPADKANIDALELIERNLKSFREISEYFEEFLEASFKSFDTIEEESKEWFEINYPFYTNVRNFKGYQYLVNKDDIELEYHSNLFNKLLLGNNRFAQLFMEGLSNKSHNQRTVPNMICKRDKMNIDDFIRNVGQFGALSVDFKNAGYTVFIKAFTEMWARNSTIFMAYFNEKLFNIEWNTRNFKKLNDTFLHGIITAEELSKILYDLIEMEKYSIETMRGHITFELYIQKIIIWCVNRILDSFYRSFLYTPLA